jgi:lysozyme
MARARGADVSHHQGPIDWDKVKASGRLDFVICKATEGRTWVDPEFSRNWAKIKRIGALRGAYHFVRANSDPILQARHFVKTVKPTATDLLVADVEKMDGKTPAQVVEVARKFLAEVHRLHGREPMLYSYDKFIPALWDLPYPRWRARYSTQEPTKPWRIWQHTSKGSVPGISGNVDLNWFSGTRETCRRWWKRSATTQSTLPGHQPALPAGNGDASGTVPATTPARSKLQALIAEVQRLDSATDHAWGQLVAHARRSRRSLVTTEARDVAAILLRIEAKLATLLDVDQPQVVPVRVTTDAPEAPAELVATVGASTKSVEEAVVKATLPPPSLEGSTPAQTGNGQSQPPPADRPRRTLGDLSDAELAQRIERLARETRRSRAELIRRFERTEKKLVRLSPPPRRKRRKKPPVPSEPAQPHVGKPTIEAKRPRPAQAGPRRAKRLERCTSVVEVGEWLERNGISPSQNKHFGAVGTHSSASWHYRLRDHSLAADRQGELAIDVNDNDVTDTRLKHRGRLFRPRSEAETLTWLYKRIARVSRRKGWPLAEMFFNGGGRVRGYKADQGWGRNVTVSGHETHLHAAWTKFEW